VDADAIDSKDIPAAYNLDTGMDSDSCEYEFLDYGTFKEARLAFEKEFIMRKLTEHQNNVTKTAEAIGVGRSFLHNKIKGFKNNK
jgi:two-component system nitrogen regulation response regulator NtrX